MLDGLPVDFAIVLALVVVGFGGGQCVQAQHTYPTWFQNPPSSGNALWAVGYAPAYSELSDGMPAAKKDAYHALRVAHRVIIMGEKLYEETSAYGASMEGESFVETGLPDTLRSVSYVDSLKAGGMTLVLAAWGPNGAPSRPPPGSQSAFPDERPSWVKQEMKGGQSARRAVGIAPKYYNLESSWRTAEKRARRKLAFKAASKVRSLNKSTEDWQHDVKSVLTGVLLRELQIVARWADDENCYVLAEGSVEKVFTE